MVRIELETKPAAAGINRAHVLRVRKVEYLEAKLQTLMLAPGHVKRLTQSHVDVEVAGQANDISVAGFARIRSAPPRVTLEQALAEEFSPVRGAALRWRQTRAATLRIPVGGPASIIVRTEDRQAGVPTENAT